MAHLIEPHGGELKNRFTADADALKTRAESLPRVPVANADLSTVYRIADGTLSPLTGFMTEKVYNQVLDTWTLDANGKKLAWSIPISLPISGELADDLNTGDEVALTNPAGDVVAAMKVQSIFEWDKIRYIRKVYLTDRADHPGGDMVLTHPDFKDKTHLIGGEIEVIPPGAHPQFDRYIKPPAEIRAMLEQGGWDAAVAFQTRNPLHRAHEYALLHGLETLLREGKNAVAVLNPLLGETKGDDVSAAVRMETYEKLIDSGEFGEGDADKQLWDKVGGKIADRVLLLGLDIKMFYGGPAEAIMHGIYRQNMGFTHIIIGRKHADAPFHDGEAIWGDFDAQEIFDQLNGELKIQPVKVGFAAFYESLGRVDLMTNHPDEKPVFISGKQVRATLKEGQDVDPRIMRPSTSAILKNAMKQ